MSGDSCGSCSDERCESHDSLDEFLEQERKKARLQKIKHKILVLSGKGGVGKSTVAVNLAMGLALAGKRVGLLDVDIHGPSIPKMMNLGSSRAQAVNGAILPLESNGIKVMSIGFLLEKPDDAVIWRGPMKYSVIKQFLEDIEWGELDYLIVDSPPGTGDEPLSICQLAVPVDGAVMVTTPQDVATTDVRRSIMFCRQLNIPVLGVVENMSGFACPKCGTVTEIFMSGGGERMAKDMGVPFLGRIPIDAAVSGAGDGGKLFIADWGSTPTGKAFNSLLAPVLDLEENKKDDQKKEAGKTMKIAIPMANGKLSMHFGHCEQFALVDADLENKKIISKQMLTPPPHEPGVLPKWLHEQGAGMIIAGGMGQRAQTLFVENGIKVLVGAPCDTVENLVSAYLSGTLQTGDNVCDH